MTTLFLVRHGLTAVTGSRLYGRTEGIHLDERGNRQAAALVERFEGVRLSALYSSPLERCVETLEPLATARRLELRTSEALIEMDAGDWTGRTLASLRRTKLWDTVQRSPSRFHFPAGESFLDAEARVLDQIEEIVSRHPRGLVVVGTHGDLVGMLVSHYTGAHLDQFQRVVVDPASVSVVHLGDGVPRILLVNDTGSLHRFAPVPRGRGKRRPRPRARTGSEGGVGREGKLRG
ncbi:MAG: fructose-2,6-bisphosphatase [Actinomycetia bacterium]|jgi:probable phosphoglycerate mutase|nr:fructose-2,6-bisphosphatase [Actinomycetes bacterium]